MYMLAEQFNLVPLQEKALDLILYQFEGIATDQDDFLKMNHTMFAKILQDNRLRISSELKLYELVLKWLNHDRADREQHLDLLMSNVRLPLIKPQQLVEKVMVEPIMKVNGEMFGAHFRSKYVSHCCLWNSRSYRVEEHKFDLMSRAW